MWGSSSGFDASEPTNKGYVALIEDDAVKFFLMIPQGVCCQ